MGEGGAMVFPVDGGTFVPAIGKFPSSYLPTKNSMLEVELFCKCSIYIN